MRERIDANPLRAFDADDEGTRAVMAARRRSSSALEGEDAEHFAEVQGPARRGRGSTTRIDPTLVRGLDYYTRTIFSFVCDRLGAQSEIGGGGRYDGLVEQLGGPPTPAIGWAAGIERILLALDEEARGRAGRDVFIVADDAEDDRRQRPLTLARASCAGPASPPRSTWPAAAQGPAQARRPDRAPATC